MPSDTRGPAGSCAWRPAPRARVAEREQRAQHVAVADAARFRPPPGPSLGAELALELEQQALGGLLADARELVRRPVSCSVTACARSATDIPDSTDSAVRGADAGDPDQLRGMRRARRRSGSRRAGARPRAPPGASAARRARPRPAGRRRCSSARRPRSRRRRRRPAASAGSSRAAFRTGDRSCGKLTPARSRRPDPRRPPRRRSTCARGGSACPCAWPAARRPARRRRAPTACAWQIAQASASAASVDGWPGSRSSRCTIACTCVLCRLPVAHHRLLDLQRGVLVHGQPARPPARLIAAPRAWPSSSVDCGFTLTKTISTTATCGLVLRESLRRAVEDRLQPRRETGRRRCGSRRWRRSEARAAASMTPKPVRADRGRCRGCGGELALGEVRANPMG